MFLVAVWHAFLHVTGADNLSGWIYGLWSASLPILATLALWTWRQQCHEHGCYRFAKYPWKHYKLCPKHHPDHDHSKPFHVADHIKVDKTN